MTSRPILPDVVHRTGGGRALLAAVGTFHGVVLVGIALTLTLVRLGAIKQPIGPLRYELWLAPAAAVAVVVAWRAGRWRGALGLIAYLVVITGVGFFLAYDFLWSCLAGQPTCGRAPELDLVLARWPTIVGLAAGAIGLRRWRVTVAAGRNAALEGLGGLAMAATASAVAVASAPYLSRSGVVSDGDLMIPVVLNLAGAVLAAIVIRRRSSRPARDAAAVGTLLILMWLPFIVGFPLQDGDAWLRRVQLVMPVLQAAVVVIGSVGPRAIRRSPVPAALPATVSATRTSEQIPPAGVGLLWDEAHRTLASQHERVGSADGKILPFIGFAFAALAVIYSDHFPIDPTGRGLAGLLLCVGLVFTLLAASPRTVGQVPRFRDLFNLVTHEHVTYERAQIQEQYVSNFNSTIDLNEEALRNKLFWLKLAMATFLDASIAIAWFTIVWR